MTRRSLLLTAALAACSGARRVQVGSKNFTEQLVLGEILAQWLERAMRAEPKRKLDLGGTFLAHQALRSGAIDFYPEYTGTALTAILKQPPLKNAAEALRAVRAAYASWGLTWLDPLGFNNTFAMVVRRDEAEKLNAPTLSAAASAKAWRLGVGYEFEQRPDGLPGLMKAYGLRLDGTVKTMDLGLIFQALAQRQVDMIAANATDGALAVQPVAALKDDKDFFPPYECAVVVRDEALQAFPALGPALRQLSGKIPTTAMRRLNYRVDARHEPVREVAAAFAAGV